MTIDVTPVSDARGGVLRSGLAALAVILFFTNFDSYFFAVSLGAPPSYYVTAFVALAMLLVLVEPSRPLAALRTPFGFWMASFFFVTTLWAPWLMSQPEVIQEIYDRYRSLACMLAFVVIFEHPRARSVAMLTVAAAVAFASLVNIGELASLITFPNAELRSAGRSAGFYFNANTSGLAIVMGVAVVLESIPKPLRMPLLLLGAFGVAATFSRGAMLCMLVAFVWLAFGRRALGTGHVILVMVLAFFLAVYAIAYLQAHDLLNDNTAARLRLAKDDSGRIVLALKAWNMFEQSPWVGNGIGSTITWDEPVRAHNMYVTYAADHGAIGLLLFPALAAALVATNRSGACLALVLLVAGFFTHAAAEDRYSLLLLALAGVPARAPPPQQQEIVLDGEVPAEA